MLRLNTNNVFLSHNLFCYTSRVHISEVLNGIALSVITETIKEAKTKKQKNKHKQKKMVT